MRAGRLILVVATLVTILIFPVLIRDALQSLRLPNAYAAAGILDTGGRVYQNGNNDDDDNDNKNGNSNNNNNGDDDDDGDDNDNFECFANLNENEAVPCDDNGNANANDNDFAPPPPPAPPAAPAAPSAGAGPSASRCFAAGESGDVMLMLPGGNVVIRVVPQAPFSQGAAIQLDPVDPATVPAPPAGTTLFDTMVWRISTSVPCGGAAAGQLPGAVNLGIPLNIPADKSRLQIVMLSGGAWIDVPTVPDPNPSTQFISATVQQTGVYAVIQR